MPSFVHFKYSPSLAQTAFPQEFVLHKPASIRLTGTVTGAVAPLEKLTV